MNNREADPSCKFHPSAFILHPYQTKPPPPLRTGVAWTREKGFNLACRTEPAGDVYRAKFSAACGLALACASTVVAACTRIWLRVSLAVSSEKSVSRIALSAALAFS